MRVSSSPPPTTAMCFLNSGVKGGRWVDRSLIYQFKTFVFVLICWTGFEFFPRIEYVALHFWHSFLLSTSGSRNKTTKKSPFLIPPSDFARRSITSHATHTFSDSYYSFFFSVFFFFFLFISSPSKVAQSWTSQSCIMLACKEYCPVFHVSLVRLVQKRWTKPHPRPLFDFYFFSLPMFFFSWEWKKVGGLPSKSNVFELRPINK